MPERSFDLQALHPLPRQYYLHNDVVGIARGLLGKVLVTQWHGQLAAGRIVETEAYAGEADRASHAYRGRTPRTAVMFADGGTAYVYLCYGLHQMFNIVTATEGIPHAVLVRALEPLAGIDIMLQRTGKKVADHSLTRGPGNVGKAMGFHTSQSGRSLQSEELFIALDGYATHPDGICSGPRIGVDYAGDDALLPYRFWIQGNPYVSGKKKNT